ncbi:MAG: arginine--tRNA ligase [Rhodothermales bacterium]|nr:arginine--tRNA ligase [Rhodothermales bacterium]
MKDYLIQTLRQVLAGIDGVPADFELELETPQNPEHGDLATNAAMKLARHLKQSPRAIADDLVRRLRALPVDPKRIAGIEVAGPGFINFQFAVTFLSDALAGVLVVGDTYGRSTLGGGQRAIVEYVSANPTGPLTVGHGRNAVLGDTIANLLAWSGFDVTREYYFNDAGRQMRILGESVQSRYNALVRPGGPTRQIERGEGEFVEVPADFPEDGYQGDYIIDIARTIQRAHGDALVGSTDVTPFKRAAEEAIFADIKQSLRRLHIEMDTFFNEHSLYESGAIWKIVERFRDQGVAYDSAGAVWFKTTAFGKEKDTVLVKSTGEPTYRLPDMAYHADKFERGFDIMVDIFGADHIATYPDVLHGVSVLGYDPTKIQVVIYQFVTLVRAGAQVKMSTRKANYVTLDELMDEVGEDVTRFFFLMRSPNTHLEFDLDLAKEAREKNPVFYLQYAHARVCSILRKAVEVGFVFGAQANLGLLVHETEEALIKQLLAFPEIVQQAALAKEPHRVINYLNEVATAFTRFYDACRIIGEAPDLATARMHLAQAARIVLKNGLTVLGISAPEQM